MPNAPASSTPLSLEGVVSAKGFGLPETAELGENFSEEYAWFELQSEERVWLVGANLMPNGFLLEIGDQVTVSLEYSHVSAYPRTLVLSVTAGAELVFLEFDTTNGRFPRSLIAASPLSISRGQPECLVHSETFDCYYQHDLLRVQSDSGDAIEVAGHTTGFVGQYRVSHFRTESNDRLIADPQYGCGGRSNDFFPGQSHFRIERGAAPGSP